MLLKQIICILVIIATLCNTGLCQVYPNDSASVDSRLYNTYKLYIDTIAGASLLYNGSAYVTDYHGVKGTPFYETSRFVYGSVCYNGVRYNNIALKYDLVSDELIIKGFQNESISLIREKIDSFSVLNHLFVRIDSNNTDLNAPSQRFYDLIHDSKKIRFFVTRSKAIKLALHAEDPSSFVISNTYYLARENVFYNVANKKTLIRLLGTSDAMKTFWKNNIIKFKKDAETLIRKAVEHYDQLKSNYE